MLNWIRIFEHPRLQALVLTLLLLFCVNSLVAQVKIQGSIIDESGISIPGVNIYLSGTYDGSSTNIEGKFSFTSNEVGRQVLTASFIGMDTFKQELILEQKVIELKIVMYPSRTALGEIVVSAGLIEASSDKKRAAALSPMDVVLVASASADIAGAMNLLPGTTRNGESGQILVRGGAAYETKTYMDGMLVDKPYNSSVSNVPSRNRFSPFMFKGTSFSTGGYGAEYGQAMSSALLLQTTDLAPETNTGLLLLSVGGSLSHTKRWEEESLSLTADYTNLSPYFSLVPQDRNWIKAPQSKGFQANYKKRISENGGMFKLYTQYNSSSMQIKDDRWNQALSLDNSYAYLNTSFQDMKGDWLIFAGLAANSNSDVINAGWENGVKHQSIQSRLTAQRDIGYIARLKIGIEQQASSFRDAFSRSVQEGSNEFLVKDALSAGFGQMDIKLSEKLIGQLGARYEFSSLNEEIQLSPRISLAYKLGKQEQFSMAFGDYYQKPEYQELKLNRHLEAEKATHLLANYQKVSDDYVFRIEAYQKWYDNLVKYSELTATNEGDGYARGIDLYFRDNKTLKNGDYWVSYSYLDTKRKWRNFPIEARPDFAMKHSLALAYKQFFPRFNTAFSTSYSFNSGRPYYDPQEAIYDFHSSRTPHYHDISSTVTYLTNIGGKFTVFYLSVTNVLGFSQTFGYEFNQNSSGAYIKSPIQPPAKRMAVFALVMNFGDTYEKEEVTSEDY